MLDARFIAKVGGTGNVFQPSPTITRKTFSPLEPLDWCQYIPTIILSFPSRLHIEAAAMWELYVQPPAQRWTHESTLASFPKREVCGNQLKAELYLPRSISPYCQNIGENLASKSQESATQSRTNMVWFRFKYGYNCFWSSMQGRAANGNYNAGGTRSTFPCYQPHITTNRHRRSIRRCLKVWKRNR
jgi:hypothetical protein